MPARAVAKAIAECVIKIQVQLAVFSKEPGEHGDAAPVGLGWHGAGDNAHTAR